ncbi:hypothetical protein M378DRAFT_163443 [Amanita muscaria Koide BX008]|uniref:Uncharacterized protein n=1 Tax=Amanita muscaria (strain Koide BX008) TaxID=946122 RepID=A0A0C2TBT5_AMAMK|nr:hypothetical protein M378DRAFT_163443 [Amanita muscaria Koide BX008]
MDHRRTVMPTLGLTSLRRIDLSVPKLPPPPGYVLSGTEAGVVILKYLCCWIS